MPTMSRSISKSPKPVYVWIWLPGQTEPVVAGVITTSQRNGVPHYGFRYAPSYLARPDRISLYRPELPLPGALTPPPQIIPSQDGLAGCLRDAMPDAWGRRVIVNQLTGARRDTIDTGMFDETVYMMHSGSDRIGALDFQASPTDYVARDGEIVTLDNLAAAIAYVEAGEKIPQKLDHAAFHSSGIGGARPKAFVDMMGGKALIKFPSSTDVFPVLTH